MDVEALLRDEIKENLEILKRYGEGTEEHKKTTDDTVKLLDRLIEFEKIRNERVDHNSKIDQFDIEHELKEKQLNNEREELELKLRQFEEDKKDRLIKNVIAAAGIVIPVWLTIWGTLKSFEFEKEGTITTTMGRGFISRLFPKK